LADFKREDAKVHFKDLTPEERQEVLRGLPPEVLFAGLSPTELEKVAERLKKLQVKPTSRKRTPRRKS
jgi:hypothetical protein